MRLANPDHAAARRQGPQGERGGEACRRRCVGDCGGEDLVQSAAPEPAAQMRVDRRQAEAEPGCRGRRRGLKRREFPAQGKKDLLHRSSHHVPVLF